MKIKKRHFVGVGFLVVVIVFCRAVFRPKEPVVRGHPITYWAQQATPFRRSFDADKSPQGKPEILGDAFVEMDERSIKWFIGELAWKPSPMKEKVNDIVYRHIHFRPFSIPVDNRDYAAFALGRMGPRASNAIPALEHASRLHYRGEMSFGPSPSGPAIAALILMRRESFDDCAKMVLGNIEPDCGDNMTALIYLGSNAAPAVPLFVQAIAATTNLDIKSHAAAALVLIHSRPELSLNALLNMSSDTNNMVSGIGVTSLYRFGKNSEPAWSNLVERLQNPDAEVRTSASNALWLIDPYRARQLGISPGTWNFIE